MNRKRLVCLLVCVTLALTLVLGGCGAAKQAETTAAATTAAPQETTKEELPPVELSWFLGAQSVPTDEARILVEQEMNKMLKEKINATIKLNFINFGEYSDKMNVNFAAGEKFDLCFSASWMGFYDMAAKGAYADLTELLPQYAPDYQNIPAKFVFDACKIKGQLLGVPNLQGMVIPYKLQVREDLYTKYGAPSAITKMEELDAFFAAVKAGEKDVVPLYYSAAASGYYTYSAGAMVDPGDGASGQFFDDPEKGAVIVDFYKTDAYKYWLQWAKKAYTNGWIEKNAPTISAADQSTLDSGKYAAFFSGGGPQQEALLSKGPNYSWKFIDIGAKPYIKAGSCNATMTSINFNSTNKERAMMFINLINTDIKLFNTLCFGVEGTHFILKDGFREFPEGVKADTSPYNPDAAWAYGNSFNAYLLKGTDPDSIKNQLEFDKKGIMAPGFGFAFDTSSVNTEIGQVNTVIAEYALALESGALDTDTVYAEFMDKLAAAGNDKIIAEKQKQFDAFKAANK